MYTPKIGDDVFFKLEGSNDYVPAKVVKVTDGKADLFVMTSNTFSCETNVEYGNGENQFVASIS